MNGTTLNEETTIPDVLLSDQDVETIARGVTREVPLEEVVFLVRDNAFDEAVIETIYKRILSVPVIHLSFLEYRILQLIGESDLSISDIVARYYNQQD